MAIEIGQLCGWSCGQMVTSRNRRYFFEQKGKVYCNSVEACIRRKAKIYGSRWDWGLTNENLRGLTLKLDQTNKDQETDAVKRRRFWRKHA